MVIVPGAQAYRETPPRGSRRDARKRLGSTTKFSVLLRNHLRGWWWRALRESNPCFRRERAASWTARRRARKARRHIEALAQCGKEACRQGRVDRPTLDGASHALWCGAASRHNKLLFRLELCCPLRRTCPQHFPLIARSARWPAQAPTTEYRHLSPLPGIRHRGPRLFRRQWRALLQELD